MNEQNTTPPDMIAQAGELLRLFQLGMPLSDGTHGQDDGTIVVASAVLAVAGEIRELRNVLAMAMSDGSDANGSPTKTETFVVPLTASTAIRCTRQYFSLR